MIPPSGRFHYVTTVPDATDGEPRPLRATHRDEGLVGLTPSLEIADAGLTPNPGWDRGIWRPEVLRSRLTLRASGQRGAPVAQASFCVDRGVTAALRPGDDLHLACTSYGFLGLSILRGEQLVVAIGAVTVVPLGGHVRARFPGDLVEAAAAAFKFPDGAFGFPELPIEVTIDGGRSLLLGPQQCRLAGYQITMVHGPGPGVWVSESLAIVKAGLCSETSAAASAQLLAYDQIETVGW